MLIWMVEFLNFSSNFSTALTLGCRSEVCAPKSPVAPNLAFEHVCGRPLGLRFNKKTGDLWIADAYFGIMKVGPEGGQAEVVLSEIDGKPLMFTNDLDFDEEGVLYFTDSSTKWQRKWVLSSSWHAALMASNIYNHIWKPLEENRLVSLQLYIT